MEKELEMWQSFPYLALERLTFEAMATRSSGQSPLS